MRISMFCGLVSKLLYVEKIIDDSESEGMKKGSFWLPFRVFNMEYRIPVTLLRVRKA